MTVTISTSTEKPRAVLVGVQLPGVTEADHQASLAELSRLVDTLGFDVVGYLSQKRGRLHPAAGVGLGKLKDLAALTGGTGEIPSGATKKEQKKDLRKQEAVIDDDDNDNDDDEEEEENAEAVKVAEKATVVVVDNELTPSQLRNLEKATGVEVLDRAYVIIEIFWRHAKTREARLQVEIARLQYEAPRLREKESTSGRQRGGGVGGRGAGDEDLELDRRKIRDRIAELKEHLLEVEKDASVRRERRKEAMRVALVGYTNAGKSSLMRALSGSDVLIADKLFATLGTTVRAVPGTKPKVLLSDTVGFIKDLPHSLVASFKSTLDEAHEASLLLFVVDASDPAHEAQLEVTQTVLSEIGANSVPSLLVLNKVDRLDNTARAALMAKHPRAVLLSALNADDVAHLKSKLVEHFDADLSEAVIDVPHARTGPVLGHLHEHVRLVTEAWDGWGARLRVRGLPQDLAQLRALAGDEVAPPLEAA